MIKITRGNKPAELTPELEIELTEKFRKDQSKSVWNKPYIRNALFDMSHGKCCYCEIKLREEGKFMHVEHFHNKSSYPEEVVKWDNLLPSCNRCNISKGTHDTYKEEIINPCIDNPKDYFYIKNYRYRTKNNNEKAKKTIDVLYLNDTDELVGPRFKIGNEIQDKIQDLLDKMQEYILSEGKSVIIKNKIVYGVRDLLKLAQPTEEYSATVATIIICDEDYKKLKEMMVNHEIWNENLTFLEENVNRIALLEV